MSPAVRWRPGLSAGDQLPDLLPGGQQLDADRLGYIAPRAVLDALEPAQIHGRHGETGVIEERADVLDRLTRVPPQLRRGVPQDVDARWCQAGRPQVAAEAGVERAARDAFRPRARLPERLG